MRTKHHPLDCPAWGHHRFDDEMTGETTTYCDCGYRNPNVPDPELAPVKTLNPGDEPPF